MSEKQDRQGARTINDLEMRYGGIGKTFAEVMGVATDARESAEEAEERYRGLDQEEIFKRLTNNGLWEGMYEANGEIYINASYIKSGEFIADLIKAGILQSKDGETFKLDLDQGTLALKANGVDIFNVSKTGATLSGWNIDRDFIGDENAGLNGRIQWLGVSPTNGPFSSMVRFYAGKNKYERRYASLRGQVSYNGTLHVSGETGFLMPNHPYLTAVTQSIYCRDTKTYMSESDFDTNDPLTYVRSNGNKIVAHGKLTDESLIGTWFDIQVEVNAVIPAFQVLDDGKLLVDYAEIGGVSFADLVERVKALEAK